MPKEYNLGSKTDMRRLEKDLNEIAKDKVQEIFSNNTFDVTCPLCGFPFSGKAGLNTCPGCLKTIDISLK